MLGGPPFWKTSCDKKYSFRIRQKAHKQLFRTLSLARWICAGRAGLYKLLDCGVGTSVAMSAGVIGGGDVINEPRPPGPAQPWFSEDKAVFTVMAWAAIFNAECGREGGAIIGKPMAPFMPPFIPIGIEFITPMPGAIPGCPIPPSPIPGAIPIEP